jgi:hypothetical protein
MWLDERLEFADATALNTSGTDTDLIGDVIDLGVARDIGQGQPLYFVVQVTTLPTSGGSATVQFSLASDAAAAIATNGTQTIHFLSNAFAIADLVAGWQAVWPLPSGDNDAAFTTGYERYLGFQTVTGTAALTAGAVNAFLTLDAHGWKSYADANN